MSIQLCASTLPKITFATQPAYDRSNVTPGIVHIGIGGFHRAHQAVYTDDLLASGDNRWGITGVSLRSSTIRDALAPQDFLYSVQTLGEHASPPRIIGSVTNALAIAETGHLAQTLDLLAHPATQVVSLTITEKGYCANPLGELDTSNADILHDLQNPQAPRSAPGLIALGVYRRMQSCAAPLTILSCDNLSSNGRVTANVVAEMARNLNPELVRWLANNVSFPSSMVDRIVPQTSEADITAFEAAHGYRDLALTSGEPFSQWVIEDNFAGERPAWNIAGAQFTENVALFERAKLQLLNATHSALAYLGLLSGYSYVHQAIADPALKHFVQRLLDDEITPEVVCPDGMDLADYKASILKRFANEAVPYKTLQVASDGSLKLPQRIFPTIEARLSKSQPTTRLCLVVAGWIKCLAGNADDQTAIRVGDPAARDIAQLSARHTGAADLAQAIAKETSYFGELANNDAFLNTLTAVLAELHSAGSVGAAQSYAN